MDEELPQPDERRRFSVRQLLGAVNLRDFGHMVLAELIQLTDSVRLALEALPHLPFGPLLFFGGMVMVFIRLTLLFIVVFAFGTAIVAITLLRGLARLAGGGRDHHGDA